VRIVVKLRPVNPRRCDRGSARQITPQQGRGSVDWHDCVQVTRASGCSMASLFRYTVEPTKVRDPDHGVIDERMILDAVREDQVLFEEEARDLAAQAQASAAQGKNLKALINARPVFP